MRRTFWPRRGTTQSEAGLRAGFRSGLEVKNALLLAEHGIDNIFETLKVRYERPATLHHYCPDFPLPNGVVVETKGRFMANDRQKHLLIKAQRPDLDIRFVFSRAKAYIAPGSRTTLGEWATKHGFKWAEKLIPVEWIHEPPNPASLAALRAPLVLAAPVSHKRHRPL